MNIYILEKGKDNEHVKITLRNNLQEVLKKVLRLSEILLIPYGGDDLIVLVREHVVSE